MRRMFIWLTGLLLLLSTGMWAEEGETYDKERDVARQWLAERGLQEAELKVAMANEAMVVFSASRHDGFCVVARADVWDRVRQPVLAYSTEGTMREVKDMNYRVLFALYEEQIDSLRKVSVGEATALAKPPTIRSGRGAVAPLLGNLRWGQGAPYNSQSPHIGQSRIPIGCVPLAMAMVMRYHEWPRQGVSDVYIHPQGLQVMRYQFNNFQPQWGEYKERYQVRDTVAVEGLSRTLGTLSLCCDPGISETAVAKNINEIKPLFVNNLGYSGRIACEILQKKQASEVDSLLRREIDGGRPCIVSRGGHAFVCDGYDGDFFHLNLGWHGKGNGYYQLAIGTGGEARNVVRGIVYGMEPQREEVVREICLTKANTLRTMLPEEELQGITSLTLSGPIGGDDIRLLRRMAGAADGDVPAGHPWGALRRLDLSQAKITKDKHPYLTRRASGTRWKTITRSDGIGGTRTEKRTFDFNKMDEKAWHDFQSVFGTEVDGIRYSFRDGICLENHCLTEANTVGRLMFSGCSSLCEIILPEGLKRIGDYAFRGCQSIQTMRVPPKTRELGRTPFDHCLSLAKLWLPKGIQGNGKYHDHCSHGLTVSTYK